MESLDLRIKDYLFVKRGLIRETQQQFLENICLED